MKPLLASLLALGLAFACAAADAKGKKPHPKKHGKAPTTQPHKLK